MKLASREVHFILYTGPPVCQAPPERILFPQPERRRGRVSSPPPGCGKVPSLVDFFHSLVSVAFPPRPRKSPRFARRLPCCAREAGDMISHSRRASAPRAPPPDPEPSSLKKRTHKLGGGEDLCPLRRNLPVFNIFFRSCGPFGRMAVVPSKGSGLSTRLRESRPPGTG